MNINTTVQTLDHIFNQLNDNGLKDHSLVASNILDLESILLTNDFNTIEETKIFDYMKSKHMLSLFQRAYELFETNLET